MALDHHSLDAWFALVPEGERASALRILIADTIEDICVTLGPKDGREVVEDTLRAVLGEQAA